MVDRSIGRGSGKDYGRPGLVIPTPRLYMYIRSRWSLDCSVLFSSLVLLNEVRGTLVGNVVRLMLAGLIACLLVCLDLVYVYVSLMYRVLLMASVMCSRTLGSGNSALADCHACMYPKNSRVPTGLQMDHASVTSHQCHMRCIVWRTNPYPASQQGRGGTRTSILPAGIKQ